MQSGWPTIGAEKYRRFYPISPAMRYDEEIIQRIEMGQRIELQFRCLMNQHTAHKHIGKSREISILESKKFNDSHCVSTTIKLKKIYTI